MASRRLRVGRSTAHILVALLLTTSLGGVAQASAPAVIAEDFSDQHLGTVWYWENEFPSGWSLAERPGFLRVRADIGGFIRTPPPPRNVLLTRVAPADDFRIEIRLEFEPTQDFQYAGLIFYSDPDNFLAVGREYCGAYPVCVGDGVYIDHEEYGVMFPQPPFIPWEGTAIFLRAEKSGSTYTFSASHDGQVWLDIGEKQNVGLRPGAVGLYAVNGPYELPVPAIADFDYFRLSPTE